MEIAADTQNTALETTTWREGGKAARPQLPIPKPEKAQFWVDFDGTITRRDVLDELILKFAADDSWQEVERLWQSGQIGSLECLTREFDVVRVEANELSKFLNNIPIDPGFISFLTLLRQRSVPMAILSDGIEQFIRPILARAGAGELRIRSNAIDHRGTRLKLLCPHNKKECQSKAAHCKCASAKELGVPGRAGIYIGDGRSDLCPARTCQVVFAKGALARAFKEEGRPYYEFDTLHDVVSVLARAWSSTAG